MKLPILDLSSVHAIKQLQKIVEEYNEVIEVFENVENMDLVISELLDLIQASFGMLRKLGYDEKDVKRHYDKLKNRESEGGYKIIGAINFNIEVGGEK